jgi:hypothetical protein
MSESVYFLTLGLFAGTILAVFGMKYFSAIQQAKARAEREDAYRLLAQGSAQAQQETAATLRAVEARLAEVERLLKQVE